jgi:phage host-nuclease inhibitor protein Gam
MARSKPKAKVIADAKQAEAAMLELAQLGRQINAVEIDAAENIDLIKANAAAEMEPLKARQKELGNSLCIYATLNKDQLFKARKSQKTPYGVFGWRKATKIKPIPKMTLAQVLERLQELDIREAIAVKESVNKEAMRGWQDSKLKTVGMRRVVSDEFFIEPAEEELGGEA